MVQDRVVVKGFLDEIYQRRQKSTEIQDTMESVVQKIKEKKKKRQDVENTSDGLVLISRTDETKIHSPSTMAMNADETVDLEKEIKKAQGKKIFRRFAYSSNDIRITVCVMVIGNQISVGISRKLYSNRGFNKKLGRIIAEGRAKKCPIDIYPITSINDLTDTHLNSLSMVYRKNYFKVNNFFVNRKEEIEDRRRDHQLFLLRQQVKRNIFKLVKSKALKNEDLVDMVSVKENKNASK